MHIRPFFLILIVVTLASCSGGISYTSPSPISTLEVSSDMYERSELVVSRGRDVVVTAVLRDETGKDAPITSGYVPQWITGNEKLIQLRPTHETCLVIGVTDWFDNKDFDAEPTTTITLLWSGSKKNIVTHTVVDVGGTWKFNVSGKPPVAVTFRQYGHKIIVLETPDWGTISKNSVSLTLPGIVLTGALSSRTAADGQYVTNDGGAQGTWSATKL